MNKFYLKYDFIAENIKNKEVLDIGCVESMNNFSAQYMKNTQHYKLKQYTKKLIGIDLEEKGVKALNDLGCECYCSLAEDAYKLNLGKFDIILLGDIIEHIPNPNFFLLSLRKLLKPNGEIICTTPNALSYEYQLKLFFHRPFTRHQHTAWYCRVTLGNLMKYSGFNESKFNYGVYWKTSKNIFRKIFEPILFKINEEYASHLLGIYKMDIDYDESTMINLQKQRIL